VLERAKKGDYIFLFAHRSLAITYAMLDQGEEARVHLAELLKVDPNYTINRFLKTIATKNGKPKS